MFKPILRGEDRRQTQLSIQTASRDRLGLTTLVPTGEVVPFPTSRIKDGRFRKTG